MLLNVAQKEAIDTITGNVAVIATAGSGKTTVLTKRIENMVANHNISPSSILAITFSKKAKESISNKLEKLNIYDVNVETFHSLALKIIINKYGANTYKVWTTQWEHEKCLQDICGMYSLCFKDDVPYNEIYTFIGRQKVNMVEDIHDLVYSDEDPFNRDSMKLIYQKYEEYKKDKGYIEFNDFLNIANKILDEDKQLKSYYQGRFQYILSDEFQDISMSQALLLRKLNTANTMVVGDALQAIYSFRGGNSKYMLDFDREYSSSKIINLNTNYRCSSHIVYAANLFATTIPDSKHRYYVESIAANPNGKKPEYNVFRSEYDECEWISKKISTLLDKYSYKDIAILARTNAQLTKAESILYKNNIPFSVVDGKFLSELPEIKLILSYLKLSLYENDDASFEYLYNKPNRWLDKKFLQEVQTNSIKKNLPCYSAMMTIDRRNWRFKNGIDEIYEVINYLQNKRFSNIGQMISYLRGRLDIDAFVSKGKMSDDGKYNEQIENLNAFENLGAEYESLSDFINYVSGIGKNTELTNSNKVNLLTIHKAKGLEYPVVFIIGCNDGLLPHERNDNIDDEKRLFYVAMTRAQKELYLSSTKSYNSKSYYPSQFIEPIKSAITIPKRKSNRKKRIIK